MAEMTDDGMAETWEVMWFAPDGDKVKTFTDEDKARRFAAKDEVADWHPMMNHVITTTITELVPL